MYFARTVNVWIYVSCFVWCCSCIFSKVLLGGFNSDYAIVKVLPGGF